MIRSMTGYGRAEEEKDGVFVSMEIRSLNSKYFDLNLRAPSQLREKEMEIRNLVKESLNRGKIDINVNMEEKDAQPSQKINKAVVKGYYKELKHITDELDIKEELMNIVMRMPDVTSPGEGHLSEKAWSLVQDIIIKACSQINQFREKEGSALELDLRQRVSDILLNLEEVEKLEPPRREHIRDRLDQQLSELHEKARIEEKRYEEEVLYYLEKLDVTEEKVRLQAHCNHFTHVLDEPHWIKGKKLNFIGQEMGREINTLGSKANDAEIQKRVVQMKDDLEKIKEQVLNVL